MAAAQLPYKQLALFYFSGTGNARFAAHKIAAFAREKGVEATVYNIAELKKDVPEIPENTLVGYCFPTHGFNAPPVLLKFIRKFPKGKNHVFLLNTRAGMRIGKLHTAGLGGLALWLPALLLLFKGYKTIGFRPLDLPSNWISLHPGLTDKAIRFIVNHCEQTLERFTGKILSGKPVLNGLLWLPADIIITPVSVAYYFYGRFALAKTFFASYKCTGCGVCIDNCPVGAIELKNDRPYWTYSCESCMKCMNHCPHRAIETAHGYTFLLWWLAFSLLPLLIIKLLVIMEVISAAFYKNNFDFLFNGSSILFGLIIVFAGYKLLHQLLRIKIINKIITFTSLTHFRWWRRYKAPA